MTNFDFLGKAKFFVPLSAALVLASILAMVFVGLRAGIDFTSGIQLTIFYPSGTQLADDEVRTYVAQLIGKDAGVPIYVQSITADRAGITVPGKIVTVQETSEELKDKLYRAFMRPAQDSGIPEPLQLDGRLDVSVTDIDRLVSEEIVNRSWQAILIALAAILVYISWRFRLRYAVGAIAALVHDVLIALGVFSIFQVEINLPVIAAFLTIVGYSLNDTIVIFDRVRENLKIMKKATIFSVINHSINQSLSRTINTSLTTLIPVVILFLLGGPVLRPFALALLVGVIAGTYSTIYIANPILYWWARAAEGARTRR